MTTTLPELLHHTSTIAAAFLDSLPTRHVGAVDRPDALRARLERPTPEHGESPARIVDELVRDLDGGLVASAGPRYFGFVNGGSVPAALAADWLVTAWDQNAGLFASSPAAAIVEEVTSRWILDVLGLPATATVGFVTGCQMANVTCLAAARHRVLDRVGWNVGDDGLVGAPPITVVIGDEAHVTIPRALGLLGLGRTRVVRVPADDQGRMRIDALTQILESVGPTLIVCAQLGNVHTGAMDPIGDIADATHERHGWLHVDGAFGLWARASPEQASGADGADRADSWATDGHKWLNVPYDSGLAIVADGDAHRAAMSGTAAYLVQHGGHVDPMTYVPEASRRARGLGIHAAIRCLGRRGIADLVDRCCALARRFAERLGAEDGIDVLNDVVLNQVLVRFTHGNERVSDELTRAVVVQVQQAGVCWLGGSNWRGREVMRISVSNWSTTAADVDKSADAILAALARARASL